MTALIELDDFDIDLDEEAEVAYVVAKFQAMAALHGRTLEAEAEFWHLLDDSDRLAYADELERVRPTLAGVFGLN